jgi:hypothetical protein
MTEEQATVLEKAIAEWESLTGTELLGSKQTMLTWVATDVINEAFQLDESGVTALLILNAETEAYANKVAYSVKDMVDDAGAVLRKVQAFSNIRKTLKDPAFAGILDNFRSSLAQALEHYECMTPAVKELLGNRIELSYIRRDALRALDYMREDVFAKGEPEAAPMKFNPGVYLYWNIASLLRILGNTKDSGVSLVLIQDTEEINASCFGFAIKHGNNLFLLSDKPKFDNPEQATLQSSRGGSRELAHRMEKLRFPYGFMGAWIDEKGRGQMNIPGATMPIRAQQEAVKLAEMKDLPADTLIWLAMMFDLILARYWKNLDRIKAKELSYTGNMIETPMALSEGCQALALRDYKPLQFEKFTTENVTSGHVQFRVKKTGQNQWMEERYKSQVSEELLNPLPSSTPAIPEHLLPPLPHPNEIIARRDAEQARQLLVPKKLRNEIWGTQAEIKHSHMWTARKNFATTIERLSIEEFNREKEAVTKWYVERLTANRDFWLRGLAEGKLILPAPALTKGFTIVQVPAPRIERNELAFYPYGSERCWTSLFGGIPFHNGYCREQDNFYCYLSPENIGREMAVIRPECPEALALLAGCKVDELPIYLQHWYPEKAYVGNSILDDVDPLEDIDNPWRKGFRPGMVIRFGRKGLYKLQARLGLPKNIHWEEEKK